MNRYTVILSRPMAEGETDARYGRLVIFAKGDDPVTVGDVTRLELVNSMASYGLEVSVEDYGIIAVFDGWHQDNRDVMLTAQRVRENADRRKAELDAINGRNAA